MKAPLIHIGYHKTGTTWLQKNLFTDTHPSFFSLSRTPDNISTLNITFTRDEDEMLLSSFDFHEDAIHREIQEILNQKKNLLHKFPVLSAEGFSGNPHAGGYNGKTLADRLYKIFPDGKILIVIRKQEDFILSNYFQYLDIGGHKKLSSILNYKFDGKIPFFSPNHLCYEKSISYYQQLFGKDNVLVLPYEMFKDTPKEFIDQIGKFIGINLEVEESKFSEKVNIKNHHFVNYHLRKINLFTHSVSVNDYSGLKNIFTRKIGIMILNIAKAIIPNSFNNKTNQKLKKVVKNWCGDRYQKNNQELQKLVSFDLKKYGYTL